MMNPFTYCLAMMALPACAGTTSSSWSAVEDAESVTVTGDVSSRTTGDGEVEASVIVRDEEDLGAGTVVLVGREVARARDSDHVRLAHGRAWLVIAVKRRDSAPARAYAAARAGIRAVGPVTVPGEKTHELEDLTLADERLAKAPADAATVAIEILERRLRAYTTVWHERVR
jgi:hypothetical protein